MTSSSPEIEYRCLNACDGYDCPGHKVKAIYSHVSDTLQFETTTSGKTESRVFDEAQFKAMMKAWMEIKW